MHLVWSSSAPADTGRGGGADYATGLIAALRALGHHVDPLTGPFTGGAGPATKPGAIPIVDGAALPHLRDQLDALIAADAVALIHHLGAAAGPSDDDRDRIAAIERDMLPRLRRVVATSHPVAARLRDELGVEAHVVLPGARDLIAATPDPADPLVLSVGVLTRRKAHDRLLHAMARLTDLPWRLVIAGDTQRDPAHAAELAALIEQLGLTRRAELRPDPTPDSLERAWASTTVFALATKWEGYPTAVAEALRRGIPTVTTDASGAADLLPPEAGAVCPVDDMATFGKCLRRLLFDRDLRADMAIAALAAGRRLPAWNVRAHEFIQILEH